MTNIKNYLAVAFLTVGLTAFSQDYSVDTKNSTLKWEGKKVGGKHWGQIKIKEGNLKVQKDAIVSGEFTIDMASITCNDLEGEWNEKLVAHLKSDDFFGVDKYPTSTLKINESASFKKGEATVKGVLTIKGKTHPIEFKAKKDGESFTTTIVVDRTLYDVRYGSDKFFDNLGDKAISDEFTLKVKLNVM